jgi:serine protease Do
MYGDDMNNELNPKKTESESIEERNETIDHQVGETVQEKIPMVYTYEEKIVSDDTASRTYYTETIKEEKKKKKKGRYVAKIAWVALLGVVFGGFFQITVSFMKPYTNQMVNTNQEEVQFTLRSQNQGLIEVGDSSNVDGRLEEQYTYNNIYSPVTSVSEEVGPSIVTITSTVRERDWFNQIYENVGTGSGIIFGEKDDELLIVTNYHVIQNSSKLVVTFIDESTANATVKGVETEADLAVLAINKSEIEQATKDTIKKATFGNSDALKVGEMAIAIGNPLGYSQTVTVGVVSALNREVQLTDKALQLIQTDAAINPGNSGGALVNAKGEVVGINVLKFASSDVEGMGFAIPINHAKPIIEDIVNQKPKPFLGIYGKTVSEELAAIIGLPIGIQIEQVTAGTPAFQAGIKAGDILIGINDAHTFTMEALQEELANYEPGDVVTVKLIRIVNNKLTPEEIEVTLGNKLDYELNN